MPHEDNNSTLHKIITALLKESDPKRLFEILRNLNSKLQYAPLAQALMTALLPRMQTEKMGDLREMMKIMQFYSEKHMERADKGLKKAYYPEYVLS